MHSCGCSTEADRDLSLLALLASTRFVREENFLKKILLFISTSDKPGKPLKKKKVLTRFWRCRYK